MDEPCGRGLVLGRPESAVEGRGCEHVAGICLKVGRLVLWLVHELGLLAVLLVERREGGWIGKHNGRALVQRHRFEDSGARLRQLVLILGIVTCVMLVGRRAARWITVTTAVNGRYKDDNTGKDN